MPPNGFTHSIAPHFLLVRPVTSSYIWLPLTGRILNTSVPALLRHPYIAIIRFMKTHEDIFTKKPFVIKYDQYQLEVSVEKLSREHFVRCMFHEISGHEEAFNSMYRFFNELEWFHSVKPRNFSGGHVSGVQAHYTYNVNCDSYLLRFKQRVFDTQQHLALGFYREAECNESPFYRFMCYRKILETPFAQKEMPKKLVPWIDKKINNLECSVAKAFRDRQLRLLDQKPLSEWLKDNCRDPLFHAAKNLQVRDPSNYDDREDIKWANTVMKELACKLITEILKVPSEG
jgi:hypothetical protein